MLLLFLLVLPVFAFQKFDFVKQILGTKFHKRTESIIIHNDNIYYTCHLQVGSQSINFHLDTGSSDTWFMNSNVSCLGMDCKLNGVYNSSLSKTYFPLFEPFSISYSDGTEANGSFIRETITLPSGNKVSNVNLGSVDKTTTNIAILGLGFNNNSVGNCSYNFPMQLKHQGLINKTAYSLYLNSPSSNAGAIIFGGYDNNKYYGQFPRLPIVSSTELAVQMKSITINHQTKLFNYTTLLDSGSTLSFLVPEAVDYIGKSAGGIWNQVLGVYEINCNSTDAVVFNFNGVGITVPVQDLMIPLRSAQSHQPIPGKCALGIAPTQDDFQTLGDNFLRRCLVVFNLEDGYINLGQAVYNTEENIVPI